MYQGSQNTNIPQLSASKTDVVLRDGTQALSADWDAGPFEIRAQTFQSDVATGTAPIIVASTTLVTNLNADLLDGQEGSYYLDADNFNAGTLADARVAESNVTQHQGAIDHGSIAGLSDDDHSQYLLADGTRALSGDLSAGSNKVTNLATPTADADAANKSYVDSLVSGLKWKPAVRVATTAAGALATSFENGDTVDGVVLSTGDRILLKNQINAIENGIYTVEASGAPTRADDMLSASGAAGSVVFVDEGSTNADTSWVCTDDSGSDVVGTDALTFAAFSNGTTDHGALTGLSDDDHTQYLLVAGTRGLSANWDAGSFQIRAQQFYSDVTSGTAPFVVESSTLVTGLNADLVDGIEGTALVKRDGTTALTANWDVGSFEVRAQTFQSDVITGTAPFTIASSTLVSNLNADQVDGIEGTALVKRDGTTALTADWDAGAFQIRALKFYSDATTGTAPFTVASTTLVNNLNADLLDGFQSSAFATAIHTHAASAITSGTLAHERGGLEADVSAVAIGDIIAGSGTGTIALVTSTGHSEGDVLTRQSDGSVDYESPPLTNSICDGRLTTESGVPLSTSDRTSQGTIYFTPHKGNRVALYNGTVWKVHNFAERSLALSSLTSGKNYDVFLYDNSGTLTLELTAWTNDTTRATAITLQDGVYVKSGSSTRRYLGTIRTTSTTTTEDSDSKRFVWNYYNQVARRVNQDAAGSSTTYATSGTYRAAGGDSNVRCYVVAGLAGYPINLIGHSNFTCASDQAANTCIGEDSTTTASTTEFIECRNHNNSGTNNVLMITGGTADVPLGYHYYQLLEKQDVATTTSWLTGQLKGDWLC